MWAHKAQVTEKRSNMLVTNIPKREEEDQRGSNNSHECSH